MSNTQIQIRRSSNTGTPAGGVLEAGELAYSYATDTLFLGNSSGTGIINIGGLTSIANVGGTIVRRDDDGVINVTGVNGYLRGQANTAEALSATRTFTIDGDVDGSATFDGTNDPTITVALDNTGVAAATYGNGDGTSFAVITVDAKGRITSASNVGIGGVITQLTLAGDGGTPQTIANNNTLTVAGGDGITTTAGATDTVTAAVDSTVVRTTGDQTIGGVKTFSGNVVFSGETFYANTTQLDVGDNMVVLNADLPIGNAPSEDAGIEINRGNTNSNASIQWNETSDWWELTANTQSTYTRIHHDGYANATALSTGTVPSARISGSYTGITGVGTITTGVWNGTDIAVADGGTGASTAAGAATNLGLGTSDSPQFAGVNIGHATDTTITRTAAGQIAVEGSGVVLDSDIGATVQAWDSNLDAITGLANTDGQFIVGSATGWVAESGATVRTSLGLGTGDSPQFTSIEIGHASDSTLARVSAGDISIEGNLLYRAGGTDVPVTDGGTGASSFTTNGLLYGQGSSALAVTAAGTEGQILQANASGVPTFGGIDCGLF